RRLGLDLLLLDRDLELFGELLDQCCSEARDKGPDESDLQDKGGGKAGHLLGCQTPSLDTSHTVKRLFHDHTDPTKLDPTQRRRAPRPTFELTLPPGALMTGRFVDIGDIVIMVLFGGPVLRLVNNSHRPAR